MTVNESTGDIATAYTEPRPDDWAGCANGHDPLMRPDGVFERMRELGRSERRLVQSWTDRALRVELIYFVDLCARLWFSDHGPGVVLKSFDSVVALLDDPGQLRTGSDFEKRCLMAVRELRPMVGGLSEASFDDQDSVIDVLTGIPPLMILGECEHESHFDLICWNEANSLSENLQTPYLAARHIASEDFHEPADRFGLVEPMTELAVRYEDRPDERNATGAEIARELEAFRARAPWPIPE